MNRLDPTIKKAPRRRNSRWPLTAMGNFAVLMAVGLLLVALAFLGH